MQTPQDYSDLPERTKKRTEKYKDAAWQFIHGGVTVITELSKRTGLPANRLYTVCSEDDWRGYLMALRSRAAASVWTREGIEAAWTEGDLARIHHEDTKRHSAAQSLQHQRDTCIKALSVTDNRTPKYTTLLKHIEQLTALIGMLTQHTAWNEEREARRAKRSEPAQARKNDDAPKSQTVLLPPDIPQRVDTEHDADDAVAGAAVGA